MRGPTLVWADGVGDGEKKIGWMWWITGQIGWVWWWRSAGLRNGRIGKGIGVG